MTRLHYFELWEEWNCSVVTLTPVTAKALQTFSFKISSPRLSGTGFISIASIYDNENLLLHFFSAGLSFVINENYSFLISAIPNKSCHVLTQNHSYDDRKLQFEQFFNNLIATHVFGLTSSKNHGIDLKLKVKKIIRVKDKMATAVKYGYSLAVIR